MITVQLAGHLAIQSQQYLHGSCKCDHVKHFHDGTTACLFYLCLPLSETSIIFQGHSSVKAFKQFYVA